MKRTALSFLLFTACTGSIGGDEPPTEQVTNTVTVVVRDGYLPIGDVQVIFQNADDSVVLDARTAGDGRATAEMPAGGNVTVIRTYPAPLDPEQPKLPAEIYTYVGVKAGDKLEVMGELDITRGTPNAINVKVPMLAEGTVKIVTPCGSGQGTAPTIPITVMGCALEVPFYVTDGTGQSFLVRAQVSENVDLSYAAFSDRLGTSLSATNVPADISAINAELRIEADAYELATSGTKRVDQTAQTITMPDLAGVDGVLVASYQRATGGTQIVASRAPYTLGPTIVDGAVARIPYTTKVQYAPTGISWSEDGTGTVDFVIATLNVTRPDPVGGPNDVEFVRTIVAPHGTPNLRTPQLPVALYNPIADDTIAGSLALVAVTGGYDGARNRLFAYPSITDIAPMNGSATISYTGTAPR